MFSVKWVYGGFKQKVRDVSWAGLKHYNTEFASYCLVQLFYYSYGLFASYVQFFTVGFST